MASVPPGRVAEAESRRHLDATRPGALSARARGAARVMLIWSPEHLTAPQRRFLVDVLAARKLVPEAAVRALALLDAMRQPEGRRDA